MPPSCGTKINKTAASQMERKVISERFLRGNYFGDKGDIWELRNYNKEKEMEHNQKSLLRKISSRLRSIKKRNLCRKDIKEATLRLYNAAYGKPLDLENPVTINEKLQYLKLNQYYNNPLVTTCVDKYLVKDYLKQKGYGDLTAKLYAVYDSPEQIEWDKLPNQFVIKCNHGCGYNIICENKDKLDKEEAVKKLKKWLSQDFWTFFAEAQYRFIKKKILVEEYLGKDIHTYKFYCFNGIPKICYVSTNGEHGEYDKYYDFFDMDWNHLDIIINQHEHYPHGIAKPEGFEEMKDLAVEFCKDFPFVRVDLYNIDGKIYLSEFTFVPTGGYMKLEPDGTDLEWGSWVDITKKVAKTGVI